MQTLESVVDELKTIALEGGATAVIQIEPKDIVVAQWVRNKCQFGCSLFGKRFTCPPYAPTPEETAVALQNYHQALLVEFGNLRLEQTENVSPRLKAIEKEVQNVLYHMERAAFLSGYERAFAYKGGPCQLCQDCPAIKLENPNLFYQKECKYPKEARPSMEGAGIDVFSTVRRAGLEVHVVRERDELFKNFGLVLLE